MIERKAAGEEVVAAPEGEEREATKAPDLMAALEESIAAVQGQARRQAGEGEAERQTEAAKQTPEEPRRRNGAKAKASKYP